MKSYAIIQTGGKQYLVHEDDVLSVEKLDAEVGSSIEVAPVLAVSNGEQLVVGNPTLEGASITAKVLEHYRGKKIVSFKKKRRKGYRRKVGHRQDLTKLKISAFLEDDSSPSSTASVEETAELNVGDLSDGT